MAPCTKCGMDMQEGTCEQCGAEGDVCDGCQNCVQHCTCEREEA